MLARSPGFATVAIVTLTLGVGANTAVLSVVNVLFFHPPGIARPERVVKLRVRYARLGLNNIVVSAPDFALVRDSRHIFASAALETTTDFNHTSGGWPEGLQGAQVS
jgi:hypothetical protein